MGLIRLAKSNGCWLEVFDAREFRGNRCRIYGPAEFISLRIAEQGWTERILSLHVGPGAYVQCFQDRKLEETIIWFLPGQSVESVADLGFDGELNSIRIYDRPPFAYEPGYSAYMLWAAGHVARMRDVASATCS